MGKPKAKKIRLDPSIEKLIMIVRQNEPIYNPKHKWYRDNIATMNIWHSIAKQIGIDVEMAKTRW